MKEEKTLKQFEDSLSDLKAGKIKKIGKKQPTTTKKKLKNLSLPTGYYIKKIILEVQREKK